MHLFYLAVFCTITLCSRVCSNCLFPSREVQSADLNLWSLMGLGIKVLWKAHWYLSPSALLCQEVIWGAAVYNCKVEALHYFGKKEKLLFSKHSIEPNVLASIKAQLWQTLCCLPAFSLPLCSQYPDSIQAAINQPQVNLVCLIQWGNTIHLAVEWSKCEHMAYF